MSGASIKRAERVAIACANNIAALSVLHKPNSLISKPFVNPQALHRRQWPGYSLPFDVETKLTSTLAFLASITHKSENVTATCIQEIPETSSVNVLVAVNKGSVMEGRKVLDRIRREFKDIFSTLAQVKGLLQLELVSVAAWANSNVSDNRIIQQTIHPRLKRKFWQPLRPCVQEVSHASLISHGGYM